MPKGLQKDSLVQSIMPEEAVSTKFWSRNFPKNGQLTLQLSLVLKIEIFHIEMNLDRVNGRREKTAHCNFIQRAQTYFGASQNNLAFTC